MSGVRSVVWDEWRWVVCEMDGVKWVAWDEGDEWCMVVRDEWWGISGERRVWWKLSVVRDECVYDALCEMSERSSVRCVCMWDVVRDEWDEWCEMVVRDEWCQMRWEMMSDEWESGVQTAAPNTVYAQQGAKLPCQEDINAKFSQLLAAQLPRTQFTHSKLPNPHGRKPATQNFRSSYWRSYPEHSLRTARRQTRMSARHQRKVFAAPIGAATPSDVYTQQGAKPAWQEDINTKLSHLLLAQLPGTQFTHCKAPNPHVSKTSAQNFRSSYWHSRPEHSVHTARCQTRVSARHQRKIFAALIGAATPNTVYAQQGAKLPCQEDINAKFSQLLAAQLPRTQFTHSKAPNSHARKTSTQNFRSS